MALAAPPRDSLEDPGARWTAPQVVAAPDLGWLRAVPALTAAVGIRAAGWAVLAVTVMTALAGWVLRWQELRLAAVACGVVWLIALGFTVGRQRLEVGVEIDETRVVVGQPAAGTLLVSNPTGRRVLVGRLDLPIGAEIASFSIPTLGIDARRQEKFTIPTDRRGVVSVGPVTSVRGDPFGLTGRESTWGDETHHEVYVHPVTVALQGRMTGFVHDLEGHASTRTSAADMSFQSLREYAPGDDRRHVHWRSSAHIGRLMVRQFEETLQSRVALGLDEATGSYLGSEDFELAVSITGSIALATLRGQNPLSLFDNRQMLPAVSGPRALDELSRVERVQRCDLFTLANTVLHLDPRASVVFLVTGAGVSLEVLRRACGVFDLDTRVIGVAADPEAKVSVRNIANVSFVRVPSLDLLGRCLRRAMA